jgi:hypothetical protein
MSRPFGFAALLGVVAGPPLWGQACLGGAPLPTWSLSLGLDGSITEVTRQGDVVLAGRAIGPLVLRAGLGRMAFRHEPSSGRYTLSAVAPFTLVSRVGFEACASGAIESTSLAGADFDLWELSVAGGVGRLWRLGSTVSFGVWGRLSRVRSRLTYPPGAGVPFFPPTPPVEERFIRGTLGLAVTGFGRVTVRVYYEGPLGYAEPQQYTLTETIASDRAVGVSLAFTLPRPW